MIYLDNAATSVLDENAAVFAANYAAQNFYNPSAMYKPALIVKKSIDAARQLHLNNLTNDFGAYKLIFTSGGTEADNIAVFSQNLSGNANVITTKAEHSAVYSSFIDLKNKGLDVRFAEVGSDGCVNKESLLKLVDDNTRFVSVTHVCNETGCINDINGISLALKKNNPRLIFHSDGVQAYGKLAFKLGHNVDLYSASSHKIGGFKGTGFLAYKNNIVLKPFLHGGGQEYGLRSGTENILGIIAFEKSAANRFSSLSETLNCISEFKAVFLSLIDKQIFNIISPNHGSPYIISISAVGLKGQVLQNMLSDKGVICGTGSACSSKNPHSRILKECAYPKNVLDGVLRISFSHRNKKEDIILAAQIINDTAKELKEKML